MKYKYLRVTTATLTLLLAGVATAQTLRQQPPPKYALDLNKSVVDDALFQIAHAGKVNIIADATEWPEDGGTVTTSHADSTIGWLLGMANQFDLTLNEVGLNTLSQLPAQSKNYVLWREPDIEPILEQARKEVVPTVRNEAAALPLSRPEGVKNSVWNAALMEQQQQQASQEVAAWLQAQGVSSASVRSVLSYSPEQMPESLRNTLRELARASTSNMFPGLNSVKTTVLRRLDDEAWKDARLRYQYDPREQMSAFYIEVKVDGEAEPIGLKNFYTRPGGAQ